jgi:hypothetical protein
MRIKILGRVMGTVLITQWVGAAVPSLATNRRYVPHDTDIHPHIYKSSYNGNLAFTTLQKFFRIDVSSISGAMVKLA